MSVYILLLLFVSIVGIIWSIALLMPGRKDVVAERLEQMKTSRPLPKKKEGLSLLKYIVKFIADISPSPREKQKSRYRTLLTHAGFRQEQSLMFCYGLKLILTAALPLLFLSIGFRFFDFNMGVVATVLLAVVGFLIVDGYLAYKARTRQEEIFHNMPDVLDLLAIIVEAGMGIDSAIRKVSEEQVLAKTPLALELKQIVSEIGVGLPRTDAFRNLYTRTGLQDIKSFTDMMIQSEKFGTSLAQALKAFSEGLRTRRRQLAEEAAAKTTIKLVFPLVLCIFPALFIVILGPAVISIFKAF
ncbi:MAG: type II secretion system F family protein [Nitrospirae bacterium]|nr:type II secretion system F family protein [Nitrospirota bacterium]